MRQSLSWGQSQIERLFTRSALAVFDQSTPYAGMKSKRASGWLWLLLSVSACLNVRAETAMMV